MYVLIFGDVHGNLPAFELMLKTEKSINNYICLGDLVNYGPWSNECVDLAMSLPNINLIMGNHEEAFINECYDGSNKLIHQFFNHIFPSFERHNVIKSFIQSYNFQDFTFTHSLNKGYIFPEMQIALDRNYVIGHSHIQFKTENSGFSLYNPGSVGQNRLEINRIDYMVFDTDKKEFTFKHLHYSVEIVINEMILRKYPKDCIDYYLNKNKT